MSRLVHSITMEGKAKFWKNLCFTHFEKWNVFLSFVTWVGEAVIITLKRCEFFDVWRKSLIFDSMPNHRVKFLFRETSKNCCSSVIFNRFKLPVEWFNLKSMRDHSSFETPLVSVIASATLNQVDSKFLVNDLLNSWSWIMSP